MLTEEIKKKELTGFPQTDFLFYQRPQDSKGARTVSLPGFEVSLIASTAGEKSEVKHGLKLSHTQQTLLLSAPDTEAQAKWLDVLSRAARGETPTEPSSTSEHRKSQ